MKDNNRVISICLIIIAGFLILGCLYGGYLVGLTKNDNLYSIPAKVTAVHHITNPLVGIVDTRGEEWLFASKEAQWKVGDEVTVIFDSRGTGSLADDIIVNINWLGEWES